MKTKPNPSFESTLDNIRLSSLERLSLLPNQIGTRGGGFVGRLGLPMKLLIIFMAPGWSFQATAQLSAQAPPSLQIVGTFLNPIYVGQDGSFQVVTPSIWPQGDVYNPGYYPADAGFFIRRGTTVYGLSHVNSATAYGSLNATGFRHISQTQPGVGMSPITTIMDNSPDPVRFQVTQTTSLANPADCYFLVQNIVSNETATAQTVDMFAAADIFLGSSDKGYGILLTNCSQVGIGGTTLNRSFNIFIQSAPGGLTPTFYQEDYYYNIWHVIAGTYQSGDFNNSYLPNTYIDNGAGLEWKSVVIPANSSVNVSYYWSFCPNGCVTPITGCIVLSNQVATCINTNQTYYWTFCVTNDFNSEIQYLSLPNPPAGVTFSQDIIQLPVDLQPGQGTCVSLYVTNMSASTNICFTMGAHNTNFFLCCSITNCLTFTPCCAYVVTNSATPILILGPVNNCVNYSLTIKNVSQEAVSYLFFTPDPYNNCLVFTPDIIHLNTPLLPGQTSSVLGPIKVCRNCPQPLYFLLSLLNSNLVQCCSIRHRMPSPTFLPIAVGSPLDGSFFLEGANIPLAVDLSGDITFSSVLYRANGQVVASNSVPPFSAIWSNAPPGVFVLSADGVETNGGAVWTSDPVTISVYAAKPPSIVAGSFWRYLDNGSDQGTAWRAPGFDDSLWTFGQAPLGYGNGNEATVINGGPATNRYVTTYFRSQFFAEAPSSVSNLTVRLQRADGGKVYLNGVEIFSSNMPTGAVNFATLAASAAVGTNATQFFAASVSPSLLVPGENTLAVEVHIASRTNAVMRFDLALVAIVAGGGPASGLMLTSLKCENNALHFCLPTTAGATYLVESTKSLSPPQWTVQQTIVGDGSTVAVTNAINATPQQFYRVRVE